MLRRRHGGDGGGTSLRELELEGELRAARRMECQLLEEVQRLTKELGEVKRRLETSLAYGFQKRVELCRWVEENEVLKAEATIRDELVEEQAGVERDGMRRAWKVDELEELARKTASRLESSEGMVRHLSLELSHSNESLESARAETVALQSEVYASVEEMLVSLVESNVSRGCGALFGTDAEEEEGEVAMACGEEEEEGACFRRGIPSLWSYEELRWVQECEEETGDYVSVR